MVLQNGKFRKVIAKGYALLAKMLINMMSTIFIFQEEKDKDFLKTRVFIETCSSFDSIVFSSGRSTGEGRDQLSAGLQ